MATKGSYDFESAKKDPYSPRAIKGYFSDEEADDLNRTLEVASYEDVDFDSTEARWNDDDSDSDYLCESYSPKVRSTDSHEKKTAHGAQLPEGESSPKPHRRYKPSPQGKEVFVFEEGTNLPKIQSARRVTSADDQTEHGHTRGPRGSKTQYHKEHGEIIPNQVFVELNELMMDKENHHYWQEAGRWIKYEEDLDKDTGRWGKPCVPSLTFRSLLELRNGISKGAILLDLKESTFPGISVHIVEKMLANDQIRAENKISVLNILLQKHRHHLDEDDGTQHFMPDQDVEIQLHHFKKEEHHRKKHHSEIMDKLPENTEATIVLVGCVESLRSPTMSFVRLETAVHLESILEISIPTRFIYVLLGPSTSKMNYHEVGRSISTLMSDRTFHKVAYEAKDSDDLLNGISEFLDCSIVIPPTEVQDEELLRSVIPFQHEMLMKRHKQHDDQLAKEDDHLQPDTGSPAPADDDDPLKRTGKPFGGLIRDIKRRHPKYLSDIKDALNAQCLATIIFIYFAALSPAITFGGLLEEKTKGLMGVSELIISTAIQGVIFCLIGAQPILVLGFSGPLLVFEEAFYSFSEQLNFDYLIGRVWIGFWLIIIVTVLVAFEGSFLVRFISRFTQEIFSILISLIFIYETFNKLFKIFKAYPLLKTYNQTGNSTIAINPNEAQPNTALLSLVLMFGTFSIAFALRKLKTSKFFPGTLRRVIGDFGVPIAILVMVLVDFFIKDTYTQKLFVPDGLSVTDPKCRGWFISPLNASYKDCSFRKEFPYWMMAASVIPAILVFILVFMESQITTLIVSKAERKMVKGSGFHVDLLLIVVMGGISALFGVPWLSATTVRTVTHCNALTVMSKSVSPGDKPQIQYVMEQRVTGFFVAILVGMSIVIGSVLRMIPLAVLFGIFLYMGVTSLNGIQLFDRLLLLLVPPKYHPDCVYVRKVRTRRMHIFTIIQLLCIGILWAINKSVAALAFPFVLILTVPLRMFGLSRIFSEVEMKSLDGDEAEPTFEEKEGIDVYDETTMPS
ncbi:anion exchange protein 2-like isoform X1 [Scyliorhinus canicula]|uniref:anion exchange protein 2-like isoform X1 n=2 Tax=Scyliorhinus canicula TaxID=7830 RepID=UPI0018F4B10B|nr:anion exchange protein 2-like isoform X1 [Scyliorhinus canicula]